MKKLNHLLTALLATAALGFLPAAHAVPTLRLFDGTTTVTLADGDPGDLSPLAGHVVFNGAIGEWLVNTTTGVGNPLTTGPHLDLNSINASNIGSGQGFIDIKLSDVNFTLGGAAQFASFLGLIGGTTQGTVAWQLFIDDTNALFGTPAGGLIGGGTTTGPAWSNTLGGSTLVDGTFSMTLAVRITHGNGGLRLTSFDFEARLVPEPGTLLLIGAALLGVVLIRRRA